jgi:serine/threonine-protein kinase
MDRQRLLAVNPYLDQALDLPEDQIESWLEDLQSREPQIAADIRELLRAQVASSFLQGQATPPPLDVPYAQEGELIGHYRVLREIGRGGMSVVFLAERADGHFEQQVALKILRFGAPGGEMQLHFAQERQILASLNHPSIARLIDGGSTNAGLPYLAMEYVEGLPIDRYCDENCLNVQERLVLFLKVAEAVQHAHRHLIVHRDIKPSNIVVTRHDAVRLLDFGIAKLLDPDSLAHAAPPTRDIGRLMTPEYATPEQVRGDPITTATDIYQLGLLLYNLLTGRAPYELSGRTSLESLRVICETEPMRPAAAVSRSDTGSDLQITSPQTISAARRTTPDRLCRLLRGDLEAILLMALRKEPERRYASVSRLIEDIERYLQGRPVDAYKGAWTYRAGKFVRRHAASVTITAAAICALGVLIAWHTIQLANERDRVAIEAQRAQREAATASQVSEFLSSVLRGSRTRVATGTTSARELLDLGAERIDKELAGQPAIQGRLLNVIGDAYTQYDVQDRAALLLERALQLNAEQFGDRSREVASSKYALAVLARNRGEVATALQLYREALDIREEVLGKEHVETADVLNGLASVLYHKADAQEALRTGERALGIYQRFLDKDDERILNVINTIVWAEIRAGNLKAARARMEDLLPRMERALGPEHRYLAGALSNLARIKVELGDYAGVEQQMRRALSIFESLYGPAHSDVVATLINLGKFLMEADRFADSVEVLERAITVQRKISGPGHRNEAHAQYNIGLVRQEQGDYRAALAHFGASLDIYRKTGPYLYGATLRTYAETLMNLGELDRAAPMMQEGIENLRKELPGDHYDIAGALIAQGVLLTRTGQAAAAEPQLRAAVSTYERTFPSTEEAVSAARSALGECLLAQGKVDEAEPLLLDSARRLEGRLSHERRQVLQRLQQLYKIKGSAKAEQRTRDALNDLERRLRAGSVQ